MRVAVIGAGLAGLAAADALVRAGHEVDGARGPRAGRRPGPFADACQRRRGRDGRRVHPPRLRRRQGDGRAASGSGSGTRACATGGATRSVPRCRRARSKRRSRQSRPRSRRRIGGRGRVPPRLLARLEIDPGAREAILARTEVSAAATAETVPAAELGLLARVSDDPAPGIAGGNQRLALALAGALPAGTVQLGAPAEAVAHGAGCVVVRTGAGEIPADACVVALPAPLARSLRFEPELPAEYRRGAGLGRLRTRGKAVRALGRAGRRRARRSRSPIATGPGLRRGRATPHSPSSAPSRARHRRWSASGSPPGRIGGSPASPSCARISRCSPTRPSSRRWDDDPFAEGAYSVSIDPAGAELLRRPAGPDRLRRRVSGRRDGGADGGGAAQRRGRGRRPHRGRSTRVGATSGGS